MPGVALSRLVGTLGGALLDSDAGGPRSNSAATSVRLVNPADGDPTVTGITLRAQDVQPGDVFAALSGSRVHGAVFSEDAVGAGAVAILTDRAGLAAVTAGTDGSRVPVLVVADPRSVLGRLSAQIYGDPSRSLDVIGVTGTSGKTTTCFLIESALAAGGHRTGLLGTVQTRIDGVESRSSLTTPEAPDLQAMLAVMVERGVEAVVMEVSSHALALGRVSGTTFAVGAFTNLSQDHLDFHPDMESYFQAKSMLFDGRARSAVIDIDDEYGVRLAAMNPDAVTVSTSGAAGADWSLTDVQPGPAGRQQLRIRTPAGEELTAQLTLPGRFNVANALVALACVQAAGRDVRAAAAALPRVVVPGRMERIDAGQEFLAIVDYAHKPAALAAVLDAVSENLSGRLIVVVGAGGDRDKGKRPLMGAAAARLADLLVITDDNPRSESPAAIRAALLAGARHADGRRRGGTAEILEIGDRHEAIRAAIAAARPGDAVVVAGKGHEQGQDVGGVVHPFVDRDELLAALAAAGHRAAPAQVGR